MCQQSPLRDWHLPLVPAVHFVHWRAAEGEEDGVIVTDAVTDVVGVTDAVIDGDADELAVMEAENDLDGASSALVKHSKLPAGHRNVSIA
jgi:hypothetical protein